ncbi:hypothetical protein BJX65DRAFT_308589 [Aspergillus insuetus]
MCHGALERVVISPRLLLLLDSTSGLTAAEDAMIRSLVMLAVAANATTLQAPRATAAQGTKTAERIETTPAPLSDQETLHHLSRRDDTTSQADASVCGYYAHLKNSRLACYYGSACAFYAADSAFPGMVGCCPTGSTTAPCTIYSTCYNSAEISATPSLTDDEMGLQCTYEDGEWCHTRTWPALNVADFGCTYTSASSGWVETMYTYGTLYDEEDEEEDQVTETLSLSWISESDLPTAKAISATTTTSSETASATPTPESTSPTVSGPSADAAGESARDDGSDQSGSSTPIGPIVGGVVGGVGGLVLVAGALFLLWRHKKKKQDNVVALVPPQASKELDVVAQELWAPSGPARHEMMADPMYAELPARAPRVSNAMLDILI